MKIRSQIIFAQAPTALIILFVTIFFIIALTSIEYRAESILVDNFKSILSIQKLNDSAEELNSYILQHPNTINGEIKKLENQIEQELFSQEKAIIEPGEEKELTKSLRDKWEFYKESIHSLSQDKGTEKTYKELKQITTNIIGLNQDALIRKKDDLLNFICIFFKYRCFCNN